MSKKAASLDLNNVTGSSPRIETVKRSTLSSRRSGTATATFPSPGTPNYRSAMQKGWSSERVPLRTSATRKQVGAALLPLNNGRTLPSKWEDAERWILSPVSGDVIGREKRPKSKSGPLGPPGVAYYSMYSPAVPMFEGRNAGNVTAASPFSAGVLSADGIRLHPRGDCGVLPARTEPCIARSASVHGCSEMQSQPSMPAQGYSYYIHVWTPNSHWISILYSKNLFVHGLMLKIVFIYANLIMKDLKGDMKGFTWILFK